MGIVVTLAMLMGLLLLLPSPVSVFREGPSRSLKAAAALGGFVLIAGLWNAFWYGLRHLESFWGQAALVSGVFMIAAALMIFIRVRGSGARPKRRWFHWFAIIGLLLSFLLYAITLVQLNLGMDILR